MKKIVPPPNQKQDIKIFEAFAGLGSQFQALKNIAENKNWNVSSVGTIEWFIPAIIAYNAIHYTPPNIVKETFEDNVTISSDSKKPVSTQWFDSHTKNSTLGFWLNQSKNVAHNLFDITSVTGEMMPKGIDIFTYSFPCQDISHQGLQKGFSKGQNTRSGLLWQVDRILTEIADTDPTKLPKYLLLENVKAISNDKNMPALQSWLDRLEELGYTSHLYMLNSANFGSCQNRERVFGLSVLKTHKEKVNFEFQPLEEATNNNKKPLKEILNKNEPFIEKYNQYKYTTSNISQSRNLQKYILQGYTNFASENFVLDVNYSGTTLTASGAMSRIKLFYGHNQIREMLPRECFKYMGFTDEVYDKVNLLSNITPTKQIYLCGNSIVVEVLEAIFNTLVF